MDIFPATTVTTMTSTIEDTLAGNITVIVGVIAFVVAVRFSIGMFNKWVKRLKA